jgi:signal transduction histidine kinase
MALLVVSPPFFRYTYPYAILFYSLAGFYYSLREKNFMMSFYGVAGVSDALKILMIPNLPASRFTITYMLFIFAYSMRKQISLLEENARFEAGSSVALQIAHDIRSPLAALRTIVPTFQGQAEFKELALSAVQRVSDVANQFLQKTKLEHATGNIHASENVCALTRSMLKEKKAELAAHRTTIVETYPESDLFAQLDASTFAVIISNIINNSIEAVPKLDGCISVTVTANENDLLVIIQDNGKGIPPEVLARIGERGLTSKTHSTHAGTGMGLYHAKKSMHRWNGSLEIISVLGQGTKTILRLPRIISNA